MKSKFTDDEVFVINPTHGMGVVILRLKKIVLYKCCICGLGEIWQNQPITLQMDHINGNRNDNQFNYDYSISIFSTNEFANRTGILYGL